MASRGGFLVQRDSALRSRHPIRYHSQTKVHKRKKKKPEWDDTVNDLTAYRATKQEQEKRSQLHKSKNVHVAQQELREKKQRKVTSPETPENVEQRKLAIFHEVLYGRGDKLQDVLAESDQTLSVVKDIFGDDPKRYLGFPNVTVAPLQNEVQNISHEVLRVPTGVVASFPDTPTHLSLLSDSVMRTPALNELPDQEDGPLSSPETLDARPNGTENISYPSTEFESRLDLHRFQQFVSDERTKDRNTFVNSLEGRTSAAPESSIPAQAGNVAPMDVFQAKTASEVQPENQPSFMMSQESGVTVIAGAPSVMKHAPVSASVGEVTVMERIPSNDRAVPRETRHVKSSSNKTKPKHASPPVAVRGLKNLDDLKMMVENLENEISDYERETGRQPSVRTVEPGSFTGYTAALVTSITKLMGYLKESESQRHADMIMRESIIEGFSEQRALVDALTNDIIQTQEHNVHLQEELRLYRQSTDEQLHYLKRELHAVLKSYEYQALSSAMDTLYSLKPLHHSQKDQPLSADNLQNGDVFTGAPQLVKLVGQSSVVNPSSFIPVTTIQDGAEVITPRPLSVTHTQGLDLRDHSQAPHAGSTFGPSRSQTRPQFTSQPQTLNGPSGGQQVPAPSYDPSLGPSRTQQIVPTTRFPIMSQPDALNQPTAIGPSRDNVLFHGSSLGPQLSRSSPQGWPSRAVQSLPGQDQVHHSKQVPLEGQEVPTRAATAVGNSHGTQSEMAVPIQGSLGSKDGVTFGRGLLGGPSVNGDLRQKLQNMAIRQRTGVVVDRAGAVTGQNNTAPVGATIQSNMEPGSQGPHVHHTSPHVHFHEPLVVHNLPGASHMQGQWPSEISPAVSPIPYKNQEHSTGAQVIVNVPRVWQD